MKSSGDFIYHCHQPVPPQQTAGDYCVSFALSSRRRKVVSFILCLTSRAFPLLHRIRLEKMEDNHSQHSSFCHQHKACGIGKKSGFAVYVVRGSSHVQNMGRADFKELQGCTSSLGSTFPAPQLHSRAVTLQLAVICPAGMPWFILVSSRSFPPYNTGVSERVTGKNPFRNTLCAYTSVTPGPMELRTKLQAWHTPCRKKGSGGSPSVPAVLDKMERAEQKSPTQPLPSESRASHHAPQLAGPIKSCNLLLSV